MEANAADANAFFQAVKQQYGEMAPAEIPQSHKDKLKQLNSDREAGALRLKQDLQATFDAIVFERFDSRLNDEASSRIQTVVKGDKAQ